MPGFKGILLICCVILAFANSVYSYSHAFCTEEKFEKWCYQKCKKFDASEQVECTRVNNECGCKAALYLAIGITLGVLTIPTLCCCFGICYFLKKSKRKKRGEVLKLPPSNMRTNVHTISQPQFLGPAPAYSNNGIVPENYMPGSAPLPTAPIMI